VSIINVCDKIRHYNFKKDKKRIKDKQYNEVNKNYKKMV